MTSFARLDLSRTLPSARSGNSDAARSNFGSSSFYAAVNSEAPHSPATGTQRLETAPVANEIVADDEQRTMRTSPYDVRQRLSPRPCVRRIFSDSLGLLCRAFRVGEKPVVQEKFTWEIDLKSSL